MPENVMLGKDIDICGGRHNRGPLSKVLEALKCDPQYLGKSESNKSPVFQIGENGLRKKIIFETLLYYEHET